MPEICRFNGIVVRIHFREHPPPHFHVNYGEYDAQVSIDHPSVILERLPSSVERLTIEWATARQRELLEVWDRASRNEPIDKIAPIQ